MIRKIRTLENVKKFTVDFGNYVVTEVDKVYSACHYQCTGGEGRTCEQLVFKGGVLKHIGRGFVIVEWKGAGLLMRPGADSV